MQANLLNSCPCKPKLLTEVTKCCVLKGLEIPQDMGILHIGPLINSNYSLVQNSAMHWLKYRFLKSLIVKEAEHSEFPLKLLNAVGTEHQSGLVPKVAVPQLFANY